MPNNVWIQALQEYNKGKNKWCVVRKGTPEHAEVMKIMNRIKGGKKDNSVGAGKKDNSFGAQMNEVAMKSIKKMTGGVIPPEAKKELAKAKKAINKYHSK